MAQINLHTTPEFEKDLKSYMKAKRLSNKSEAIRSAVQEAAMRSKKKKRADFSAWRGMALNAPPNPQPRFENEDELWEKS